MTEQEWASSVDPGAMERLLRDRTSTRKARLYACACCRHVWELVENAYSRLTPEQLREAERMRNAPVAWTESEELDEARRRHAVEVAEAYADGRATEAQLRRAWQEADNAATPYGYDVYNMVEAASSPNLELNGYIAATAANHAPDTSLGPYCEFLRCICGNPFRPLPPLPPAVRVWNGGTVVRLARAIYDQRRFEDLPILADALLDAGCDDEGILAHCRGPGRHARGCFVVDLILAKDR
jgi:hypothetical protein